MALQGILLGGLVGGVTGTLITPGLSPAKRATEYAFNRATPNAIPPLDAIIAAWLKGYLTDEQFDFLASSYGMSPQNGDALKGHRRAWKQILLSQQTTLGLPELYRLYNRQVMNEGDFDLGLVRHGIIDTQTYDYLKLLRREPFSLQIGLQLFNRGLIPLKTLEDDIRERGTVDPQEIAALTELGKFIPGPSDIVRFMTRDVEDIGVVQAGHLDEDFDRKYKDTLEQWGEAQGITRQEMQYYWRAHWQYPSAGQFYRMLHLLRPENIGRYRALVPGVQAVDIPTVIEALKVDDMAPGFVNELAAISYSVPARFDIRRMYRHKVVQRQDLSPMYQDLGYDPNSADKLAKALIADVRQDDLGSFIAVSKGNITKAYELGAIDFAKAVQLLKQHGLTTDEANLFMANEQVAERLDFVKEVIVAVKRLYLTGTVTFQDAQAKLLKAGVNQVKVDRLFQIWDLLKISKYKQFSAGKTLDLFKRGLITAVDVDFRLGNLGYLSNDRILLIETAIQDIAIAQQKIAIAVAKSLAAKQKAQKQAIKEAEAHAAKLRADLAKHGSPSQLARWFADGIISRANAVGRLVALGWPTGDAEILLTDALAHRKPAKSPKQ